MVPFDERSPFVTSGIRVGTPALTTRGFDQEAMKHIAELIHSVLQNIDDEHTHQTVRKQVQRLCEEFPLYDSLKM